jgi:hypothetical protein
MTASPPTGPSKLHRVLPQPWLERALKKSLRGGGAGDGCDPDVEVRRVWPKQAAGF